MPRSIWKGAVSFGLVTIPVKVYGATETKDISFRQVHAEDGGRIRYKRVCEVCGEEVPYAQIAKGFETSDGRMAILTDEDFSGLPEAQGRTVDVVQFVPVDQIDPTYVEKTYVLEAEGPGIKPYVLLREALVKTDRMAVVKLAMRQRETLAVLQLFRATQEIIFSYKIEQGPKTAERTIAGQKREIYNDTIIGYSSNGKEVVRVTVDEPLIERPDRFAMNTI